MLRPSALRASLVLLLVALAACDDSPAEPTDGGPECSSVTLASVGAAELGAYTRRYTAEVAVRGSHAYTSTWGQRLDGGTLSRGDAILVWDVTGATPVLVDSVVIANAGVVDVGDVAVSPDGRYLVASTEYADLALVVFDLADPRRPREVSRFTPRCQGVGRGAHTAEIGVVDGKLYAVLAANSAVGTSSRVVIVDLSDPTKPQEVYSRRLTNTLLHDSFLRDGVLFLALWDHGLEVWDVGGLGRGGTMRTPALVRTASTLGGNVHNVWWLHDPVTLSKRWLIVGEESTTGVSVLRNSRGDIHVVDLESAGVASEVAFYHAPDHLNEPVGTHNFTVDEPRGLLYAAMYNGGVHVLDVRGDLGTCEAAQRDAHGRCDLALMGRVRARLLQDRGSAPFAPYVWGVAYQSDFVYASDMPNGLWKIPAVER